MKLWPEGNRRGEKIQVVKKKKEQNSSDNVQLFSH